MKITDVKTVLFTGPSTNDPFLREARTLRTAAFVELHTDGGLVGLGETYAGYFCAETVSAIVEFFAPILVGQRAPEYDVSELWRRMYTSGSYWCRTGLGMAVISALEAALWDLKGKCLDKPVYELLGGVKHEKLLGYATGGPSNYPKERLAAKADHYLSLGFRAIKIGSGCYENGKSSHTRGGMDVVEFERDKVEFLRKHVGAAVEILFDAHQAFSDYGKWDFTTTRAISDAFEPFNLFLLEEACPYDEPWKYADLAREVKVPIAGGEQLTAPFEWGVFLNASAFDIAQMDAAFMGGLGPFMDFARRWEARGKKVATHAWGAGGSLMQNIHCGFAAANTCILELAPDFAGLHRDIIGESFRMRDGYVLPPQTPGLGITLTDEIKNRYPFVPGTGEFISVPGKILKP
jgi:L-alanine-DL-glutamate epimerase-like enolase superfamily enzyme